MQRIAKKYSFLFLFILTLCAPLSAKTIYKYQDESGRWHFTDRRPPAEKNAAQESIAATSSVRRVAIINRGSRFNPRLYAVNEYYGPVEIELTIVEQENVTVLPDTRVRMVLPANTEAFVLEVKAVRQESWRYRTEFRAQLGDPAAQPDADWRYLPPIPEGLRFPISQGFYGTQSHEGEENRYAVDIAMPEGTPILAVRSGVVMSIDQDFNVGGYQDEYRDKANQITVLHDDGSMAIYAHLQFESITVYPGQLVSAGQWLGNSGNTGYSSGAHLHFAIRRNVGMKSLSMPFTFQSSGGRELIPETGVWLSGTQAIGKH